MRILHVTHGFPPETTGGTERTVEALAAAMAAAGHEVAVVAGSLHIAATATVTREHHAGLEVLRLHRDDLYHEQWWKAWSPTAGAAFDGVLAQWRPDVVHVHHWIRLTTDLVRRARARGCATAVTLHDYWSVMASPVRRGGQEQPESPPVASYVGADERREAFAFHRKDLRADVTAAHVRCVPAAAHGRGVRSFADGPLGDLAVTPPPMLQRPQRRAHRSAERGHRLVTWGTQYPEKGLEVVLDALRQAPGWSLEVWGEAHDPEYRARLTAAAAGLPVTFRGRFGLADLQHTDADYAVLPSLCHESYGLTLDEALCLGLPVLASALPTYHERAPAASAVWFEPGDAGALAALLRDDTRLRRLVEPGPPASASAEDAARQLLDLYGRARAGELRPFDDGAMVTDAERAAWLWRRAERRLWTALQQPNPPAPPDAQA